MVTGVGGTNVTLMTAAGCAGRASARFARLEIREPQRRPLGAMVALTNPVWLE